ncbi:carbonic anhydrase [Aquimarina algicola]|uniref:Carbonic anhydrase n=1 Tax=Aquimarina algicola TaxID=2589995 RepID=A0A504J9T2_9FLAO|nr:carbonic anhydrase family protein [Aquimarina algicola]TPN87637.1 carbonic anhydrase family protein [Aquimarina algicola]
MKSNFLRISLVALLALLISCSRDEVHVEDPVNNAIRNSEMELSNRYAGRKSSSECNFEYEGGEGPENWANLCGEAWMDCSGNSQSPINIVTNKVVEDDYINNININYSTSKVDIYNNGHTVQFNYTSGSSADLNNIEYDLLQFHFHTESEHTINGYRYPMEAHLVHRDPNTGLLAVVGVFFEEGDANKILKKYFNNFPEFEGTHYTDRSRFHIEDLLPEDLDFYTYPGSLTTPGCSEIVTWYVLKEPITASVSQIRKLKDIMHKNYRPVQELNGRVIRSQDD